MNFPIALNTVLGMDSQIISCTACNELSPNGYWLELLLWYACSTTAWNEFSNSIKHCLELILW